MDIFNEVVGRHMGGQLIPVTRFGSTMQTFTPQWVVKDMIELLPDQVWNEHTTFLDISCKTGIFLMEIYKKLDEVLSKNPKYADTATRRSHILNEQLYGLALDDKECLWYSSRNVYGRIGAKNMKYLHAGGYSYDQLVKNKKVEYMKALIQEEFGRNMFDVVVGNPPYNNDIYLDFVTLAQAIQTQNVCMITPAKWQAKGGPKNEAFRRDIVPFMDKIIYYPDCTDIFSIDIAGGITYYNIEKERSASVKITCGGKSELLSNWVPSMGSDLDYIDIVEKIIEHPEFRSITNASDKRFVPVKSYFTSRNFGDVSEDLKGKYYMWSSVRCIKVPDDTFKNLSDMDKYKVYCNHNINNKPHPHILGPNVAAVRESCLMGFGTEAECNSIASYYSCRLIWYLAYGMKLGNICTEAFKWVPDPGKFDHIFTDQELYKKYNLTDEEISIIESVIKERK